MRKIIILVAALLVALPAVSFAQDEAEVDPKYTWDLTELFPTVEAWNQAREGVLADVYASLNGDEDLRVSETQERLQLAQILFAQFTEATAWMAPELVEVGREVVESYVKEDERLESFAFQLDDSLRNAPHTLGQEAEQALSYLSQSFGGPSNTYSLIANSDIPWPTITTSDGEEVRIDSQGYGRVRGSENRDDRKLAFDTFWNKWLEYRNSVGMVLNSHVQTQVGLAKARNYDGVLHRELHQDNIPPAVYHTLVEEVNKALPTLHRYFRLRARMLGIEQMHYYDIYPPLVSLDKEFDIETSKKITLEAMSVLGDDWVSRQKAAMDERWMHVYPQRGKRSGAYMASFAYDVHPYLLLNHNDNYAGLSTLAHEWGHAMHTLYAREEQPFETASYATFIAEIPSTSLELILQDYMTKNAESVDERLFYLGHALEGMRGTFFRQTMFAEFELALYESAERGEALSGQRISEIYGDILRRYHGHDEGVVVIDDLYTNEWMPMSGCLYRISIATCTCISTPRQRRRAPRCTPRSLKTGKQASKITRTCCVPVAPTIRTCCLSRRAWISPSPSLTWQSSPR